MWSGLDRAFCLQNSFALVECSPRDSRVALDELSSSDGVDSTDSHQRWVREVDYPLMTDVDKKLAEEDGILHRSKGATYRGVRYRPGLDLEVLESQN